MTENNIESRANKVNKKQINMNEQMEKDVMIKKCIVINGEQVFVN